jgi:hypothetical protein
MSYAFVFRAYPDVDHMAPLAWRLLEDGEEVHAVISPGYDADGDYRLRFLREYERFHVHKAQGLRRTLPWALGFLVRHQVRVVGVEWGYGLPEGYEHLRSVRGLTTLARSVAGSVRRIREPRQVRTNLLVAARVLGRAAVCLPHGLSIKLDAATNGELKAKLANGPIDWRDRNRFAAYVLNTEHHRQWFLKHAMGDPRVMQTWGALRWAPEWFEVNRRIAPTFEWPPDAEGRLRVVFMVPKWRNRVAGQVVIELLRELQDCDVASVVVKGHARPEDGSASPLHEDPTLDWTRLHDASGIDSVSLIAAADVVIDVGSSIGLEVVMQDKVLVNPSYLHELQTLFDVIPGSCVEAADASEVVAYLRAHAAGERHVVPAQAREELLRRAVYGSAPAPFDVVAGYSRRLRGLAVEPAQT